MPKLTKYTTKNNFSLIYNLFWELLFVFHTSDSQQKRQNAYYLKRIHTFDHFRVVLNTYLQKLNLKHFIKVKSEVINQKLTR